jgi:hypothetical protein
MSKKELKEIYKEALKEWLDAKYACFGKWSLRMLLATALIGLVYIAIWAHYNNWPWPNLPGTPLPGETPCPRP